MHLIAQFSVHLHRGQCGKALPIEYFTGENPKVTADEWQQASEWNERISGDTLIQLAGHLKGRACTPRNLIENGDKAGKRQ